MARISEAVTLRQEGIDAPILLFGDLLPDQAAYMAANGIRATLTDFNTALTISKSLKDRPLKVHIGDEVVIMGTQGNEEISADHLAALTDTINYEVTAGLTGRMPRRYKS